MTDLRKLHKLSDINSGPGATENNEHDAADTGSADTPADASGGQPDGSNDNSEDGDMFPRSYVEELRRENAEHRTKAKDAEAKADELAKRLHTALVTASNRLENPAELAYDAKHLDDDTELSAALDALLSDRPYLAKRVVTGDAGQGNRGVADTSVNLLELLRGSG